MFIIRITLHCSMQLQLLKLLDHVHLKKEQQHVFKRMQKVFIYEMNLKLYHTTNSWKRVHLYSIERKVRRHACRPLTNISENMDTTYIIPVCSNTFPSVSYIWYDILVMFLPLLLYKVMKHFYKSKLKLESGALNMFYSFVIVV